MIFKNPIINLLEGVNEQLFAIPLVSSCLLASCIDLSPFTGITACSVSPCQQEALCTPIGLTDYTCDCPDGFTGKSCETNINECDPNPCQHNGTCTVSGFATI